MKRISIFLAATFAFSPLVPALAQVPINAPTGWSAQTKSNASRVFTPPDLARGEIYSVATYDSAPLNGQTLEEYLRKFAGPVGKKPGQLNAPLQIKVENGRVVTGSGTYVGPQGTALSVDFVGVSLDANNISVARTLFSSVNVFNRYQNDTLIIVKSLLQRAKGEAGQNMVRVPEIIGQKMKPGGEIVPGVYVGNQYSDQQLQHRLRVYLYPNGEYRITNHLDEDFTGSYSTPRGVGQYAYNRNSGQLDIDSTFEMSNDSYDWDTEFCFYGRNSAGKPVIYAEEDIGFHTVRTSLLYAGPPTKRLSKSAEQAREAAIEAEKNRFKWVTAPGKGVPNAQIAAILVDSKYNGGSVDETTYLLLRDGTIYADLPVAPDTLDVSRSRQKEPDKWGRWRQTKSGYSVSWNGAPFQKIAGQKTLPAPAQVKLQGRYSTGRSSNNIISGSYSLWGVTFSKNGRFKKDSRGGSSSSIGFGDTATNTYSGYDDDGSFVSTTGPGVFVGSAQKKKNPNGAREGDYSINGYVLTLRYDNGKVARLPFFFVDAKRTALWFEGATMSKD